MIAFSVAILAAIIGTIWGSISGYYRGLTDTLMMRVVDLILTIPIIAAGALLTKKWQNTGWWTLALVIAALSWPAVSRWCAVRCSRCANGSTSRRPAHWAPPTRGSSSGTCCRTSPAS
jgi:ABC-type dipeptide/oligopeptide/nickel transport system permease subunit